jgi:ribosomal protein S18 acetylase RimI-like enzyme
MGMTEFDFSKISNEEVDKLNKRRAESLEKSTNGMLVEPQKFYLPFMNDLRFNHGYIYLHPFLIQGQTGLKLELNEYPQQKRLHLAFIGVAEDSRQQGQGNEIMEILNNIADKYGYDIDLQVEAKFGVGKRVLKKFYKKHGYVKYKHADSFIRKCKGGMENGK